MRDWLKTVPSWALIGLVLCLAPVAAYAVVDHLQADKKQSTDIAALASTVEDMAKIVEYDMAQTEENADEIKDMRARLEETQRRLERLLGRLEARLDRAGD